MKKLLFALLLCQPLAMTAQDNTWERIEQPVQPNADQKYLADAVPVADGKVVFQTTIDAPGKSARQVYDIMAQQLEQLAKADGQYEQSRVVLRDSVQLQLVGNYQEMLVFKRKPLETDYTRLLYHIIAECRDQQATIKMTRIVFLYDEERDPQTYYAEESITDRYGLNKAKTKLSRAFGKFRRKTIDRKDYLFARFERALNQ